MRVCVVTTSYPRWPGDVAETTAGAPVRRLVEDAGLEVTVLAPGASGAAECERSARLEVRRIAYFWPPRLQRLAYGAGIPWNLRSSVVAWLNLPVFLAALGLAILRFGRRADVIHAFWGVMGALAAALRPIHGRPVVVTIMGTDWRSPLRPVRWLSAWAVRRADAVTTPDRDFASECCRTRGTGAGVHFLPLGVDVPPVGRLDARRAASTPRPEVQVVTVGRLIPERLHETLIRALATVRRRVPAVRLTIIGDGPERTRLETLVARLGLADCVEFAGFLTREELLDRLASADVYVSPTSVDAYGTATVEAAGFALPVVTTRVGFPAELVIDGDTGHVVPPGDADALADALAKVCSLPPDQRRAMGRRMRARFDQLGLTWSSWTERMTAIYRSCVDSKHGDR